MRLRDGRWIIVAKMTGRAASFSLSCREFPQESWISFTKWIFPLRICWPGDAFFGRKFSTPNRTHASQPDTSARRSSRSPNARPAGPLTRRLRMLSLLTKNVRPTPTFLASFFCSPFPFLEPATAASYRRTTRRDPSDPRHK